MVDQERPAKVQEQARRLQPEHREQLREIFGSKRRGEPDYSQHLTPEALSRSQAPTW